MLDTVTKKRIDDCRDILVGKLPDPKAQIEQITIGMIYKFMDDSKMLYNALTSELLISVIKNNNLQGFIWRIKSRDNSIRKQLRQVFLYRIE